jgi:hypothetical protein
MVLKPDHLPSYKGQNTETLLTNKKRYYKNKYYTLNGDCIFL